MSLSHASPDELVAPVSGASVTTDEPVVSSPATEKRQPDIRRLLRQGGAAFLVIALLGTLTASAVLLVRVSNLTIRVNTLDAAFRSGEIGQLSSNVTIMQEKLKTLEKQVSALAPVQDKVTSLSTEQLKLSTRVNQLSDASLSDQQSVEQLQQQLGQLRQEVQTSASAIETLKQQAVATPKAPEPEKAKPQLSQKAVSSPKKAKRSVRHAVMPAAPFELTGIERRGGQTFAVVIPRGVTVISSMRLLSPGDGFMGWTLRALEGNAALFSVNGSAVRLQVQ
ncbi:MULTISPECIES: plasmid transfer protein [Pantoea]|uniref:plasmid transfer protein n=1 Tax=Pantoea TaxID=53335 RepID=UPI0025C9E544|nr:plasmid transfer protein [Pantoea ananatis]MDN4128503.1 plasmid transfer protein [Pantoea ananatis]MDN4152806.1 plasmid transfer protein [Pantoea ananatis]